MANATRTIKHVRDELAALDVEKSALVAEAKKPLAKARAESRGLTADEVTAKAATDGRLAVLSASRELLETELGDMAAAADIERGSRVSGVREGWESDPNRGYKTPKAMLLDVLAASRGTLSPQLATLWNGAGSPLRATAGADEHSTQNDVYGGFLIPTGIMPGVKTMDASMDPLAGLTTPVDMGGLRSLKINARVDKDHSTSVSGGLRVYRRVETQTVTASRTAFEQVELQANELFGVTYASEELLRQSPVAFASLLSMFFGEEFAAKVEEERLNGSGVGCYQGIANSPALITIAKEAGQAADTIVFANIVKMIARCYGYGNAVWLANSTCYPQLRQMVQPGSTIPIFATGTPGIATLEGRPIYFSERAAALGDLGDIVLINPKEYLESDGAAIEGASSVHVRFLEHEQTFKFWKTNAGAGWWRTALTPKRGDTKSPFVYLAAR